MPNVSSFYDIEDMSEQEIKDLGSQKLNQLLNEAKDEQSDLSSQYLNGDRDQYPPDWYDQYVFPVDCIVSKINNALDEIDSNSSEESSSY